MKSTPRLITRDHDPRRADQCNLHTHVIANKNKSPVEKKVHILACTGARVTTVTQTMVRLRLRLRLREVRDMGDVLAATLL